MTQPRRSQLAGMNAATSPMTQPQSAAQQAPEAAQEPAQPPVPATTGEAVSQAPQERTAAPKSKKKKVSFYQHPEEEARARAAWMHTMGQTGHTKLTQFMEAAVASYTRQLEAEYNEAKPFG